MFTQVSKISYLNVTTVNTPLLQEYKYDTTFFDMVVIWLVAVLTNEIEIVGYTCVVV